MTRIVACLLAGLALLMPAAASAQMQSRVVGGSQAASGEFPYYALLNIEYNDGFARCGGALVAARYVVTAAHCLDIDGETPVSIQAAIGDVDTSDGVAPEHVYDVVQFNRHPNFHEDFYGFLYFDAAYLELERPAPDAQLRVPRPGDAGIFPPGTIATGMGFGTTSANGTASNQLLKVDLPLLNDAACPQYIGSLFDASLMLCAGGVYGKDTCQGDSGGPLIAPDGGRHILVGLVSFGDVCANGRPAVYSDTTADPLNSYLRSNIPQVEIEVSPAQPEPGQPVTFTAVGSNPNGAYTSYAWDLDNDGIYGEATGTTAVRAFARGLQTVGVQAVREGQTPNDGDRETRRVDFDVRFRSPVGFTAPAVSVPEGGTVQVSVTRSAGVGGSGAVTLIPSGGSTVLTPFVATTLNFAPGQPTQTVNIPVLDDGLDEPDQQFRIDLTGHAGDLVPGAPGQIVVTVNDNDLPPSVRLAGKSALKARRNVVTLEVPVTGTGTLVVSLRDTHGHALSSVVTKNVTLGATLKIPVKLNARGRKALRRAKKRKGIKVKVLATYTPTGVPTPLVARKNLTLKR